MISSCRTTFPLNSGKHPVEQNLNKHQSKPMSDKNERANNAKAGLYQKDKYTRGKK